METTALILFFILSSSLFCLLTRSMLNYMAKNQSTLTEKSVLSSVVVMTLFSLISLIICYRSIAYHICPLWYIAVSIVVSLTLLVAVYIRSKRYRELKSIYRLNSVLLPFALSSMLNIGVIFFCRWLFPDVTTVECESGKYKVLRDYGYPFIGAYKPTGSYVVNKTEDTLYRVVVSYAFLGEEVNNHYNVTDTIKPMTTSRIPCPPNFVARSILPVMLPSHGRLGKIRTRRSYIVAGRELSSFENGDFGCLGINDNIRVNSLDITSNPVVWEDPRRISAIEQVIGRFSSN